MTLFLACAVFTQGDWRVVCERDGRMVCVRTDGKETTDMAEAVPAKGERVSPDGKRRAFVTADDGDAEVWVSDVGGANPKKLTDNKAIDNDPDWSPDGKRIVFGSTRSGDWQIWIMDSDGGGAAQLTRHADGAWHPRFSPDGKRIAYQAKRPERQKLPQSDLIVMNVDGSDARVIVANGTVLEHAWDPKGARLAVSLSGKLAIYDLDKQAATRTVEFKQVDPELHAHAAWNLVWRPDGAAIACQIAFLGGRTAGTVIRGDRELYIVPIDGDVTAIDMGGSTRPVRWIK